MKLITISGLDGSGKSTQIELLKNYLESQGKKVFYFHAIQFSVANILLCHSERSEAKSKNLSARSLDCVRDDTYQKSVTKASWLQIQMRKIALFIDLLRFRKLLEKLEKEGYDYLVSDRYFYDSVINIAFLSNLKLGFRKFLKPSFRVPDVAIYIQVDPEVIMKRERKPDQGIEYLRKKKELYDNAASIWNLKIIDGNRNKEEIFEEIKITLT